MDDKPPLKGAWSWPRDPFLSLSCIYGNVKLGASNLVYTLTVTSTGACTIDDWKRMHSRSHDLFNFLKITDNMLEMVQDGDIVAAMVD